MKKWLLAAGTLFAFSLTPAQADAQVAFGAQVAYADDYDFGIGARAQFDLGSTLGLEGALSTLGGVVSATYFFPDCGSFDCSYVELNGNGLYALDLGEDQPFSPYVGAGLHVGIRSFEYSALGMTESDSDTEVGLNALGGLNFDLGGLSSFAEAKIELGGAEQFILTFGVLLGGS